MSQDAVIMVMTHNVKREKSENKPDLIYMYDREKLLVVEILVSDSLSYV